MVTNHIKDVPLRTNRLHCTLGYIKPIIMKVSTLPTASPPPPKYLLAMTHSLAAIFNSLELTQFADEKDGSIRVCHIKASKVVVAGYLQGSTKTLNEEYWTEHLNVLPRLLNLDVEVQIHNIDDLTGETPKFGSKNKFLAAHILCAQKNEAEVNLALGNTYGKERSASRAAGNLPEGRAMKYVPYNSTGVIERSPEEFRKLQKTRRRPKYISLRFNYKLVATYSMGY
mmetsp:Transcript_5978/g.6707  ORF Transcript_5978/g.6707 Transcript_5978/m.6707 type:complete len:227 (+) Transcript_5978:663-1343(+)